MTFQNTSVRGLAVCGAIGSGVRLSQPFHHALPCRLTIHQRRNGIAQKGEHGDDHQHGGNGIAVAVEPVGVFKQPACQRIDRDGQQPGEQPGADRV